MHFIFSKLQNQAGGEGGSHPRRLPEQRTMDLICDFHVMGWWTLGHRECFKCSISGYTITVNISV